jgi:hypothetical protein
LRGFSGRFNSHRIYMEIKRIGIKEYFNGYQYRWYDIYEDENKVRFMIDQTAKLSDIFLIVKSYKTEFKHFARSWYLYLEYIKLINS